MEKLLCGVDLGGTKLASVLMRRNGEILQEINLRDHTDKSADQISEMIAGMIRRMLREESITAEALEGIGVVFPGHVRWKDGVCITTSNLADAFKNYPLRKKVRDNFPSVPVYLDNDANAQALAEMTYGAGRGYSDLIFMTISTGIGAGIILNGKLLRGMTGTAGEVGHAIINPASPRKCTCGNYGCLMTEACAMFLPDIAIEFLRSGVQTKMGITVQNARERVNGYTLEEGVKSGDPLCTAVADHSADAVGISVYNLFQTFNPPLVILGGGLTLIGDYYIRRIRNKFKFLAKDMMFDEMEITTAKTGNKAGVIGAAALPLE